MKTLFLLLILSLQVVILNAQTEEDLVKKVIQSAYVDGLKNFTSLDDIDKGFHPDFEYIAIGTDSSKISKTPIATWREGVRKAKENGTVPNVKSEAKFLMVDITGNAAVAKIELYRDKKLVFTDYFSLLKFKEGWRIVSKTSHRH
ncbi:MAG: nuclear transport factor 2 family protein [Bacteroidetes bacterium]|nr:nuclear transport factor 2 family protein [Bacteroidota bacterium]